jgi:hypothetical protein
MKSPEVGSTVICAETGKAFTVERQGISFNYGYDSENRIYSDEGILVRTKRQIKDHKALINVYVSGDCKTVTSWKGEKLGRIVWSEVKRSGFAGRLLHINVADEFGGFWYGKGSGPGMCITLRPSKGEK